MKDIKAIFIVAGHSTFNPGAESNGLKERELVLTIASDLLERIDGVEDFEVFGIGFDDTSLEKKVDIINAICASNGYTLENSIVIEIHTNASGGTGLETLIYDGYEPAYNLGKDLLLEAIKTTGLKNRGVKNGKELYIIKKTIPLALIFECGFIDTEKDRGVLITNINSFSEGIYNGFKKHLGFEDSPNFEEMYKAQKERGDKLEQENKILQDKIQNATNILSE